MGIIEVLLIAVGLSMDSFAVSLSGGVVMRTFPWQKAFKIAFFFGFFQGVMPLLGWFTGNEFRHYIEDYDHWIAFAVLAFLGLKMIWEPLTRQSEASCNFDPSRTRTLVGLSLATSIDALAVGLSFALLKVSPFSPVFVIGTTTFFLSFAGLYLGKCCGKGLRWGAELVGGVILLLIGVKILIEHLYFNG